MRKRLTYKESEINTRNIGRREKRERQRKRERGIDKYIDE